MNWKLIFQLSLFGLFMAVATVFFIPLTVEPYLWVPIFLFSAYSIARYTAKRRFWYGLCVGLANCVWITSVHVLLFSQYLAHHPGESAALAKFGLPTHPRLMMALGGPMVGVVSGIVIGLFALAAGKFMKATTIEEIPKVMGQNA